MCLKELDTNLLTKLSMHQVDHVTCLECCKYYVAPATAACGHTLCHGCWRGRRKCPSCAIPVERKSLQLNLPLKNLTDHVKLLIEAFGKLFNIKLDDFALIVPNQNQDEDPTKNVVDWLANSQNHFSAPISSQSTQNLNPPNEYLISKIQIHTNNVKAMSPEKVLHTPLPQDDWDKIEVIPETDEDLPKRQENVIGPMDIEPFIIDDIEYTTEKPRRSTRKRDSNTTIKPSNTDDLLLIPTEKVSAKTSTIESLKPSSKIKQTWNNVKRMKKEFSKLNKENRNKLNVSIEMCKKTQISNNTDKAVKEKITPDIIDDTTPYNVHKDEHQSEEQNTVEEKSNLGPHKNWNSEQNVAISDSHTNQECRIELNNSKNVTNINMTNMNTNKNNTNLITQEGNNAIESENKSNREILTEHAKVKFFKKSSLKIKTKDNIDIQNNEDIDATNNDDIEISIKIGKIVTNICIQKKNNDLNLKIKTDREIQTSLGKEILINKSLNCNINDDNSQNIQIKVAKSDVPKTAKQQENNQQSDNLLPKQILNRSVSTKKNTASADTGTAHFEITESVEKELSDIMEKIDNHDIHKEAPTLNSENTNKVDFQSSSQKENIPEDAEYSNELDIFEYESLKAPSVQLLNTSQRVPSKILVPTQNKEKKHKQTDKRERDSNIEEDLPVKKKQKIFNNSDVVANVSTTISGSCKDIVNDSECGNYDMVMGKVFANIDAEIANIRKHAKQNENYKHNDKNSLETQSQVMKNNKQENFYLKRSQQIQENQKFSENIFSVLENDDYCQSNNIKTQVTKHTQQNMESLTSNLCREFTSLPEENREENRDMEIMELGTPISENYDSDKSVVEETPQKNVSLPKIKQKTDVSLGMDKDIHKQPTNISFKENKQSVINLSDSVTNSSKTTKEVTVIETIKGRQTLETPLTINKFVGEIKHKSTPVARKSLNFNRENVDENDPEQTLCPSSIAVAKTTQEKEFMNEVFEETPNSPVYKTLPLLNRVERPTQLCIAGSCLISSEIAKLKLLCKERGWIYMDKYTKELTHLVVGVDEENRSQRSVKYMCALAAGKWIISYAWVEKCILTNTIVPEEPYETLDGTGEPGPRRSRVAKRKLFQGITFYCMQPFSILDVATLKDILEASGGRVVNEAKEVRVVDEKPALLLAEPEHTQEDRFTYLAMELQIVPVNYEWVLNCLGSYTLGSIYELLLCPSSILPPLTTKWPTPLLAPEID